MQPTSHGAARALRGHAPNSRGRSPPYPYRPPTPHAVTGHTKRSWETQGMELAGGGDRETSALVGLATPRRCTSSAAADTSPTIAAATSAAASAHASAQSPRCICLRSCSCATAAAAPSAAQTAACAAPSASAARSAEARRRCFGSIRTGSCGEGALPGLPGSSRPSHGCTSSRSSGAPGHARGSGALGLCTSASALPVAHSSCKPTGT